MKAKFLALGCMVLIPALLGVADDKAKKDQGLLQPQTRVYIIRGLLSEFAVARKTIPRGELGIHLKSDGSVDERSLQIQLANFGPAVRPGEMSQITKVDFKKDSIVLDLNGGTKQKRRFHIEMSGPISGGVQQDQQQAEEAKAGASITLEFGKPIPDISVDELKTMLAPVLDFNQRSAALVLTDTWPPEIQEAVKNHQITGGMTKDQVLASRGRPDEKQREKRGHVDQETWIYGRVPAKVLMVVFEGEEVVEAKEYIPGIPATKVPRVEDAPKQDKPEKP